MDCEENGRKEGMKPNWQAENRLLNNLGRKFWGRRADKQFRFQTTDTLLYRNQLYNPRQKQERRAKPQYHRPVGDTPHRLSGTLF